MLCWKGWSSQVVAECLDSLVIVVVVVKAQVRHCLYLMWRSYAYFLFYQRQFKGLFFPKYLSAAAGWDVFLIRNEKSVIMSLCCAGNRWPKAGQTDKAIASYFIAFHLLNICKTVRQRILIAFELAYFGPSLNPWSDPWSLAGFIDKCPVSLPPVHDEGHACVSLL